MLSRANSLTHHFEAIRFHNAVQEGNIFWQVNAGAKQVINDLILAHVNALFHSCFTAISESSESQSESKANGKAKEAASLRAQAQRRSGQDTGGGALPLAAPRMNFPTDPAVGLFHH